MWREGCGQDAPHPVVYRQQLKGPGSLGGRPPSLEQLSHVGGFRSMIVVC